MIKSLFRVISGKNFPQNPKVRELSSERQRALNFGAVLAGTRAEYCNSLETSSSSANAGKSLKQSWGITCSQTAVETLDWLKNEGHRQVFNAILSIGSGVLVQERTFENFKCVCKTIGLSPLVGSDVSKEYTVEIELAEKNIDILHGIFSKDSDEEIDRLMDENKTLFGDLETFALCTEIYSAAIDRFEEHVDNLRQTIDELLNRNFLKTPDDLERVNVTAWDMGRLVNVSRWCYELGYISEVKAWEYIYSAEKESMLHYTNWQQFGKSYVIGRSIWGGDDMAVTMDMVEKLLHDPASPWVMFPLSEEDVLRVEAYNRENETAEEENDEADDDSEAVEDGVNYEIDESIRNRIKDIISKENGAQNLFSFDEILPDKLENAKKSYAFLPGEDETVICLYDDSDRGTGKDGFIITSKCVHSYLYKVVAKKGLKDSLNGILQLLNSGAQSDSWCMLVV